MVNKDKVRLMTALAMYRKQHDKTFQVNQYFRYDYIVWHLILSAVRYTVCAVFIAALFVVFESDTLFYSINEGAAKEMFRKFALYYLIGLGIYTLISVLVYSVRYKNARKEMLLYASMLKRLARKFHMIDTADYL